MSDIIVVVQETAEIATLIIAEGPQGPQGATGPAGSGGIVDTGSRASPQLITSSIAIPADSRARVFLQGSSGAVVDPTLGNGSGRQELYLFVCSDSNGLTLHDASNLELSGGEWVGVNKSMLSLQWDGASKWVEVCRNEI